MVMIRQSYFSASIVVPKTMIQTGSIIIFANASSDVKIMHFKIVACYTTQHLLPSW